MIHPPSANNAALQLNMGEGKSSVIVPIVAATLANRKQLARVIVLKALSKQMFEILVQQLSHLCDRRIYYVPFSRHLRIEKENIDSLQAFYQQCMDCGGILVIQPEHILSLKLMAIDRITVTSASTQTAKLATALWDTQAWLTNNSRDVLDESDEILHMRYQLIYTIGQQEPIENHPDRWGIIQSILYLVSQHASDLKSQSQYSTELEVDRHTGNFPVIRILSSAVSLELSHRLAKDVFSNKVPTISLAIIPEWLQSITYRFLVEPHIDLSDYELLKKYLSKIGNWSNLLLLRGLLAGGNGILHYVLSQRRWKVDYGHDLRRSLLAVPYRAKVCHAYTKFEKETFGLHQF